MFKQSTIFIMSINLSTACGNTLPYTWPILVTSYSYDESVTIDCIYPLERPEHMITPCKVKTEHCAMNAHMSQHHSFDYVIATIYQGKIHNGN